MILAARYRALAVVLLATILSGCATVVASLSDKPVDHFHGTRTWPQKAEDASIEYKAKVNLARSELSRERDRFVVVAWNGQVLLAGQAASDSEKARAESIVAGIRHVAQVHNELQVVERASLAARISDAFITLRVKAHLLIGSETPGRRVKVVTENGVVYLMGLLTHEESEKAVDVARDTYGVQKIVKIFEYIAPENATR